MIDPISFILPKDIHIDEYAKYTEWMCKTIYACFNLSAVDIKWAHIKNGNLLRTKAPWRYEK